MSSNLLTDEQPVESVKKFKFYTENDKEEIEINIPEVMMLSILLLAKMNLRENKYGRFQ